MIVSNFRFQSFNSLFFLQDEPLGRLMQKYCDSVNVPFDTLRFQFDGEDISPTDTAEDLDLETDYCIDAMAK
jgi:hypothetical protein